MGIERQIHFAVDGDLVPGRPEDQHAAALTRDTVTPPALHYLRFSFTESGVSAFRDAREVDLPSTHPAYKARTVLRPPVRSELAGNLLGTTKPLSIG